MAETVPIMPAVYQVKGGGSIIVEAEVPRGYQEAQVSFLKRGKDQLPKLSDAIGHVMPALNEAAERIRQLEFSPDKIALEVGVKFVGEAGIVIARASTEANLVIKLKWLPNAPSKKAAK